MAGDSQLVYAYRTGVVQGGVMVDEGGAMGVVEYDASTSLFAPDGSVKNKTAINEALAADIQGQRDAQGAVAALNPPLASYDFATAAGL